MIPYMDLLQDLCYRIKKRRAKHSYNAKLQTDKKDDERTSIFTESSKGLTPGTISG